MLSASLCDFLRHSFQGYSQKNYLFANTNKCIFQTYHIKMHFNYGKFHHFQCLCHYLLKRFILFSNCVHVHVSTSALGGHKRASDHLEWKLQAIVPCHVPVLVSELSPLENGMFLTAVTFFFPTSSVNFVKHQMLIIPGQ